MKRCQCQSRMAPTQHALHRLPGQPVALRHEGVPPRQRAAHLLHRARRRVERAQRGAPMLEAELQRLVEGELLLARSHEEHAPGTGKCASGATRTAYSESALSTCSRSPSTHRVSSKNSRAAALRSVSPGLDLLDPREGGPLESRDPSNVGRNEVEPSNVHMPVYNNIDSAWTPPRRRTTRRSRYVECGTE